MDKRPRISVVIITYKQEELIKKAINSLLSQRDYIYEICVCDDCSPDKTWEVLQEYSNQYPGLFKLHRNEYNLGIFENIEKSWTMPTGDVIYRLAGDDECGENWLKTVYEFIKNKIDWENELFAVFGDYKTVYPTGDSITMKINNSVNRIGKDVTLLRLYQRHFLCGRSSCVSAKVLKNYKQVSRGRSYEVEMAQDSQLFIFTEKAYYLPSVGNIYNAKIGVSVHLSDAESEQHKKTVEYAQSFWKNLNISVYSKDVNLPLKNIAFHNFVECKSFHNLISFLKLYILCFDRKICFHTSLFKLNIFRLVRRIPHKNTLHW